MECVEKTLEADEMANHPEDAQESHHPHSPHDLARLGGKLVDHGRSLACPIIFMFSSPARMMLKMAGRIPTRSTRFILSEIKFFLLGQTRSRRKYLDIRKVISQRRVPWELIDTSD